MFTGLACMATHAVITGSRKVVEAVITSLGPLAKAVLTVALSGGEGVHTGVRAGTMNK